MKNNIKIKVACHNSNGEPEMVLVEVQCTETEIELGAHYDIAREMLEDAGYECCGWFVDEIEHGFDVVSHFKN